MATSTLSWTEMFGPLYEQQHDALEGEEPASVTTKDGMPTFATSTPSTAPIDHPVATAARTATYQG